MTDSYVMKSPIGFLKICEQDDRITRLCLQQEEPDMMLTQNRGRRSDLLYEAYHQLEEYFLGKRKTFSLPVRCDGTAFQQRVWEELQRIPYGETRSYEEIAAAVGNPKAVRAVGQANNRNPIMIVIPCHRVIHKNGDIAGFACGTAVKKYLLDLEKGV